MGKQSARLYYNGEDCSDLYYGGYYNLSKMYRGSTLLWERLPPKYILASGNILFTTEVLNALSTFRQYSLNDVYSVAYRGIEYIFDSYYMMLSVKETRESEPIIWLLGSENGYDWKKVYDFSDINAKDMKKYMGKLAFIAKKNDDYALCLMDSKLNIEYAFDTSQISGVDNIDILAIGNDTMLLMDSNREHIIVVKNGKYETAINKSAFYSEEGGSASLGTRASYDMDGGYFYINVYLSIFGNCMYRSKDGISWIKVFDFYYTPLTNFLFDKNYIYYQGEGVGYNAYRLIKINKSDFSYAISAPPGGCICFIDNMFYFLYRNKIYKSEDYSKVTQYIDPNYPDYQLTNAKEVRMSDKHQWTIPTGADQLFNCVCCTDKNVKIYI